jgi:branched-chain amino acid transport system ATP-binding protein
MLELNKISGGYGSGDILAGIDLIVQRGEQVALIGPNGAGKSSLMAAITATLPLRRGTMRLDGKDLSRAAAHDVVAAGLALVPEGRQIFAPFSVRDNLRLGAIKLSGRDDLAARFRYVFELFPSLARRLQQRAGTMSGGEQQMLAIGRALMSKPTMLLLDEPFLGLAPMIVQDITQALRKLQDDGVTILLVEQKLDIVLASTSRVYVMLKGRIALEEATQALARRSDLHELYFSLAGSRVPDIDAPAGLT